MSSAPKFAPQAAPPESLDFILQHATRELEGQGIDYHHIDNKTGVIIGFALIAMAQTIGAVLRNVNAPPPKHPHIVAALFVVAVGGLLSSVLFGLVSVRPRNFQSIDVLDDIENPNRSLEQIQTGMLNVLKTCITTNATTIKCKGAWAEKALVSLLVALASYAMLALVVFLPSMGITFCL